MVRTTVWEGAAAAMETEPRRADAGLVLTSRCDGGVQTLAQRLNQASSFEAGQ